MAEHKQKTPVISVQNVFKLFKVGKQNIEVLDNINLDIYSGEFVIIFGPSGCGKSTLLNTLVGLEKPTTGKVLIRKDDFYKMKPDDRSAYRRKKFGIIYQQPNWIKSLNVLENVGFPLCVAGEKERKALKRAHSLLSLFRLDAFEKNTSTELSGGQQQRVQVTRALITNPWILIADEPTGNLDTASAGDLMYVLKYLNTESKRTIVMVTHNPEYESYATKIVRMEDGMIKSIVKKKEVSVDENKEIKDMTQVTEVKI